MSAREALPLRCRRVTLLSGNRVVRSVLAPAACCRHSRLRLVNASPVFVFHLDPISVVVRPVRNSRSPVPQTILRLYTLIGLRLPRRYMVSPGPPRA